MRTLSIIIAAAAALAGPAAALADDAMGGMAMGPPEAHPATGADAAYAASMTRMMAAMDVTPTGDPDRDFVAMMTPHHRGAIDMAKVELAYGKDPVLRRMAGAIVKAQEKEIGEMKAWRPKGGR